MKKILMTLVLMTISFSAMAQETELCFIFDVPPLLSIGNAPAQKVYLNVSSNSIAGSMAKLLTPDVGTGRAYYANMCQESRGSLICNGKTTV